MNLIQGITILNNQESILSKIKINSGTEQADNGKEQNSIYKYFEKSYIPKQDWQELNEEEQTILLSEDSFDKNMTISIHKLPPIVASLYDELDLKNCDTRPLLIDNIKNNNTINKKINYHIVKLLNSFSDENSEYNIHGISQNIQGLITCSKFFSEEKGSQMKLLGLHIDRDSNINPSQHTNVMRNRIGLNLSKEERDFLFINLSVHQIYTILIKKYKVPKKEINMMNIHQLFFLFCPTYPVFKIKQKPYEFYVAPTDNCIHDASTVGRKYIDVLLTFLGFFNHTPQTY